MARARWIDVALHEAVFNRMESPIPEYTAPLARARARGQRAAGHCAVQRLTPGTVLGAGGGNGDSIFKRLMAMIDRRNLPTTRNWPDNAGRVARVVEIGLMPPLVSDGQRSVAQAMERLVAAQRCPRARRLRNKDIAEDPHYQARGIAAAAADADGYKIRRAGRRPQMLGHAGRGAQPAPAPGRRHRRRADGCQPDPGADRTAAWQGVIQ